MKELFRKVQKIIKDLSGCESFDETATLHEDLAFDSIQMVMLLINIEEKFQIVLDEYDMNPFDLITVKDVFTLVNKYVEGGAYDDKS